MITPPGASDLLFCCNWDIDESEELLASRKEGGKDRNKQKKIVKKNIYFVKRDF